MDQPSKGIYSLVLMDEVVCGIDRAAHRIGTSRSNLINQILAEYLSFTTPEMRMKNTFDQMLELMGGLEAFQLQNQPSDAMISIRSSLRYRYNPTVRYSVELFRGGGPFAGELRISCRTQSQPLLALIRRFAESWWELETRYISHLFPQGQIPCVVEEGRFSRQFLLPQEQTRQTPQDLALALTEYIRCLDSSMKTFFELLDTPQQAMANIHSRYRDYLDSGVSIL